MGAHVNNLCQLRAVVAMETWLVVWALCFISAPATAEKRTTLGPPQWPKGCTEQILVSVSDIDDGKVRFDSYLKVREYDGKWQPDSGLSSRMPNERIRHYSIRFVDAEERVLYEYFFCQDYRGSSEKDVEKVDDIADVEVYFFDWLPFFRETRKILLMHGNTVLAEKVRSEHPPSVRLGLPRVQADGNVRIPWSVSDADDGELELTLTFQDTDGEHFLAGGLRLVLRPEPHTEGHLGAGHFAHCGSPHIHGDYLEFDSTVFQGGPSCKFWVEVSDGLNSVVECSESFDLPLHLPAVAISSPENGEIFMADEEIWFTVGFKELGPVTMSSSGASGAFYWKGDFEMRWTSSIDGELGDGCGFGLSGLSAGEHIIDVSVKGTAENSSEDRVNVIVLPSRFPEFWILSEDVTLAVDYERINWPTFLCVKVRGKHVGQEPQFDVLVKYKGHEMQYALASDTGGDSNRDETIVLDGRVVWPFTEPGDYEVEVALRWTGEPSLRLRDNAVVKTFHWDGPAHRHIPANGFPDLKIIPGSLVIEPSEVPIGENMVKLHWQEEIYNSKGERTNRTVYIGDKQVMRGTFPSSPCHVERRRGNDIVCWLPKEIGTYPITVQRSISGEPESKLNDNEIRGHLRIVPQPAPRIPPVLFEWLSGPDMSLRKRAARAIAAIEPEPEHVIVLVQALEAEEEKLSASSNPKAHREMREHRKILSHLVKAVSKLGSQGQPALPVLLRLIADEDILLASSAVQSVAAMGSSAVPALMDSLQDEQYEGRSGVSEALGLIGTEATIAVPLLVATLGDADRQVSLAAADALVKIGNSAVPALMMVLSNAEPMVRLRACYALGRSRQLEVAPFLVKAFRAEKDDQVRRKVACAIVTLGYKQLDAFEAFTEALGDPNPQTRRSATCCLGGTRSSTVVPLLTKALGDKSAQVRQTAAFQLGFFGVEAKAAVPVLEELLLSDPDESVRMTADSTLFRIQQATRN